MDLISLLIGLLVLMVVIYAFKLVIDMLTLPPPMKTLVYLIFAVVVLIVIFRFAGVGNLRL